MTEYTDPILSVIIVNWNGARYLSRCFQSLAAQTLRDVQVILADNGSTDESIALTKREFPTVDILAYSSNLGYAEGNNKAAAVARGRYLLFLNNDTHLAADALAALVTAAEKQPHLAILAPQQRTYEGERILAMGLGMDIVGYPCQGKMFYADGAALFIRRDVFEELGGFDQRYFMFAEDIDLCWRARLWGYHIGVVPEAIVFHKAGGTAGSSIVEGDHYNTSKGKRRLSHRNQLTTILKNYSAPLLCVVLPLFAALTAAEMVLLTITGQRAVIAEAYLPAWRDIRRNWSYIWAVRRKVQETRVVSDAAILQRVTLMPSTISLFFQIGMPRIK